MQPREDSSSQAVVLQNGSSQMTSTVRCLGCVCWARHQAAGWAVLTWAPAAHAQEPLRQDHLTAQVLKMFPVQPHLVTGVQGPVVELRKVRRATCCIPVHHNLRPFA